MVLRRERLARRDLADVAVVRRARGLVVDDHALAALARPRLELDRAQIGHVLRADDVEPLAAHEAQIGRILLGLEFVRQFLRDDCVLGHGGPRRFVLVSFSRSVRPQATRLPAATGCPFEQPARADELRITCFAFRQQWPSATRPR
jgi:hypothetical protein